MKQLKVAGILLATLLVMSAVAYWDEQTTKKEESEEKSKNKLFSLSEESVDKILYRSSGDVDELKVELERQNNGDWKILAPIEAKADSTTITNLIKSVVDFKYDKIVAQSKSRWDDFGLETPTRIIRLESKDGKWVSLHLGNKSPVGYSVYVRAGDDEPVYIGGQQILLATAKSLTEFRDKALLSEKLNSQSVEKITYDRRDQPSVKLERVGSDFSLKEPLLAKADQDEARDLLESLAIQKVEEFVDDPEDALIKSFSKSNRWLTLSWEDKDGKTSSVYMSDYDGKFWMAFDPNQQVYKISDNDKARYDKDVFKLRDRRVFEFDSDHVTRVDIDGIDYQRIDNEFYLAKDLDDGKAKKSSSPQTNVRTLLEDLEFAKTQKFLTPKDVQSVLEKAPKHRLKIWLDDSKKEKTSLVVDIFPEKSGGVNYVKKNNTETIYVISDHVLSAISPHTDVDDDKEQMGHLDLDSLSN